MLGLWITRGKGDEQALRDLLEAHLIPFAGMTEETPGVTAWNDTIDFLRRAASAILRGQPLPMEGVMACLGGRDALAGNVLRRYVCLQLSLAPYLRVNSRVTELPGCCLLGDDLLIAHMGEDGRIDAQLPDGVWTELSTGEGMQGHLRRIRGLNELPVLARANGVIPIGVQDHHAEGDDADRVTLHWFEPNGLQTCILSDGTSYQLSAQNGTISAHSATPKAWHLIIHTGGEEKLIK